MKAILLIIIISAWTVKGKTRLITTENCLLSRNKPTIQISDYSNKGLSKLAVDGNRDSNWHNGSCMHTRVSKGNHWWVVDLLNVYYINNVTIWNRMDCCAHRFHKGIISVTERVSKWSRSGLINSPPTWIQCANYTAPSNSAGKAVITLNCQKYGRYVQVMSVEPMDNKMNLCEIEIYGKDFGYLNCPDSRNQTVTSTPNLIVSYSTVRLATKPPKPILKTNGSQKIIIANFFSASKMSFAIALTIYKLLL